jgi:VanZ like family
MHGFVASTPQRRRIATGLAITSALAICAATLVPQHGAVTPIGLCVICGDRGGVDAILNILLFLPLGASLALAGWPARRALLAMSLFSAMIELAQLTLVAGRDASLGDCLTNSAGGAMGFWIATHAARLLAPSARDARRLATLWAVAWLGLQAAVSYGLVPRLPDGEYHAQLSRRFAHTEPFPGTVHEARIGNERLPDAKLRDRAVGRRFADGQSRLSASITTRRPSVGVAPIVRIVDERRNEVALLARRRADLVFAVRTGAATLRVRPPMFTLRDAFDTSGPRDTTLVAGRQDARAVVLERVRSGASVQRLMRPDVGMGWTMVLPTQWYMSGSNTERMLGAVWLALSILPLGYWAALGAASVASGRQRARVALLVAGVLVAGLGSIPSMYGLWWSGPWSWAATLSGVCAGAALSTLLAAGHSLVRGHDTTAPDARDPRR